jgi:dihydropteroate synthase
MTKIVGILNITPDSFFDGGKFNYVDAALNHLWQLIKDGADVIDVGAESTRPGAVPIDDKEEWQRLENILPQVILEVQKYNQKHHKKILVSLDSRHSQTVSKALELGVDIINDVSGFEDFEMMKLAAQSGKKIIVMHNLGVPADKNKIIDENLDVVEALIDWMKNKLEILHKAGVKKSQIIFDIGLGFGKNAAQSIKILQEIDRLRELDLPLYVGHSNKSFLDEMEIGNEPKVGIANADLRSRSSSGFVTPTFTFASKQQQEMNVRSALQMPTCSGEAHKTTREEKTILVSKYLIQKNVEYLRVHDVSANAPKSFLSSK